MAQRASNLWKRLGRCLAANPSRFAGDLAWIEPVGPAGHRPAQGGCARASAITGRSGRPPALGANSESASRA